LYPVDGLQINLCALFFKTYIFMMKCSKCKSEYYEGMKFCGQCGQTLERACTNCGHTNPPHFKFCSECGHQLAAFSSIQKQEKPVSEVARKHITIHFSDLSGYTSLGEKLKPEEVKGIMNKILDPYLVVREGAVMDLAIAYSIEKNLCGTISAEITSGMGVSCGDVFSEDRANTNPDGLRSVQRHQGKERILFVDDEEMVVGLAQEFLKMLDYTVTAFTDSTEALDVFSSDPSRFDLVITDQNMPKLTGLNLAQNLLKVRSNIPIILCTGDSGSTSPEMARESGIREFLKKPFTIDELAGVIRKALDDKG